jgi:hypothetical protein
VGRTGLDRFDPTNDSFVRSADHISSPQWPYYADVAPVDGAFYGGAGQTIMTVSVDVEPQDG